MDAVWRARLHYGFEVAPSEAAQCLGRLHGLLVGAMRDLRPRAHGGQEVFIPTFRPALITPLLPRVASGSVRSIRRRGVRRRPHPVYWACALSGAVTAAISHRLRGSTAVSGRMGTALLICPGVIAHKGGMYRITYVGDKPTRNPLCAIAP